jgi:hypothetical protein
MKRYVGVEVWLQAFLTLAPDPIFLKRLMKVYLKVISKSENIT